MKADYHFHPNLHAKKPEKRLQSLWKAIMSSGLDAIICTEHTYKNAPVSYRQFVQAKPADAKTHVFPGAELISKEGKGIEIIAFAEEDWYDNHPLILQPLTMSFSEMVAYLEQSELHWFIPHPFLLGNPLKRLCPSTEKMLDFLNSVPALEVQNGCYLLLEKLYRTLPWQWFREKQAVKFRSSVQLPPSLIPRGNHQFLAVGSDAHHPRDIGFHVDIPTQRNVTKRSEVFHALTTNTSVDNVYIPPQTLSIRHLLYTAWTTFSEACMKREWRRYEYQHQVFEVAPALQDGTTTKHLSALDDTQGRSQISAREA